MPDLLQFLISHPACVRHGTYPILGGFLGVNVGMRKNQIDAAGVLPAVTFFLGSKLGSNLGPHSILTIFGRRGARVFGSRLAEL